MSFGTNLQYLRKLQKSMTQENLAELMGVSRQTVAKWESDAAYPEIDKLIKLSDIFSCSLDQLLRDDMHLMRDVYSEVRIQKVEGFRMARYAVVSPEPEDDAMNHIRQWAEANGLRDRELIGWDFPFVSQQQSNVFHMHGYAAACILPEGFEPSRPGAEIADQISADYAMITIKNPFAAPFFLIPNGFKTVQTYLESKGLKVRQDDEHVLPCFEKVYERGRVPYMDVYVAVEKA